MEIAALFVAVLALCFTVASFWWLNARKGALEVAQPHAYAFADRVRLRLPLAFFNSGARALIVANLRLRVDDDPTRSELLWIATRSTLGPIGLRDLAYATPFSVEGRSTREVFAEFGDDEGWSPKPGSHRRLRLDAMIHPSPTWEEITVLDWWAPPPDAAVGGYLTYRNAPPDAPSVELDTTEGERP